MYPFVLQSVYLKMEMMKWKIIEFPFSDRIIRSVYRAVLFDLGMAFQVNHSALKMNLSSFARIIYKYLVIVQSPVSLLFDSS